MATLLVRSWRLLTANGRRNASAFANAVKAEEEHAAGTMKLWKNISIFVVIPGLAWTTWNAYSKEAEHMKHIAEHGRAPFQAYPHLRIRSKPFPWGDGNHSLFHNPHTNPLPEGYEDE